MRGYGQDLHFVVVKNYSDIVSTATNTTHLKVTGHRVTFLVHLATLTGDSLAVTVEESSAATTTSAAAIPFVYRLGSAAAADTWGAVTTADSTGVDLTASDDNKLLLIDVDPADMTDGKAYLSILLSPGASASACGVSAYAIVDPRYKQLNHLSST